MDYLATIHSRLSSGPVYVTTLAMHLSQIHSITLSLATEYVTAFIEEGLLTYTDTGQICAVDIPKEDRKDVTYSVKVKTECWACGTEYERDVPPFLTISHWECPCGVLWSSSLNAGKS